MRKKEKMQSKSRLCQPSDRSKHFVDSSSSSSSLYFIVRRNEFRSIIRFSYLFSEITVLILHHWLTNDPYPPLLIDVFVQAQLWHSEKIPNKFTCLVHIVILLLHYQINKRRTTFNQWYVHTIFVIYISKRNAYRQSIDLWAS